MILLARGITETSEALQMVTYMLANCLRILANFLRSLRLFNNQFTEFSMNPLRMLSILTNALAIFANVCERLTNETNTILNSRFALFVMDSQAFETFCLHFVWMNANKSLRMSYDHYICLAINKNILRLLTKMLRKQYEYAFVANFRNMFLIFATPHERPRILTNTYECLAITLWSLRIGGELHS